MSEPLSTHFAAYRRKKLRNASEGTLRNYRIQFEHLEKFLGRVPTLDDLTDETIADCMEFITSKQYADERGLSKVNSPRTANKFRDCMLAFWRTLAKKGIVPIWPDVEPVPEPQRAPQAWTREQLRQLWQAVENCEKFIGDIPGRLFWHTLHSIAWDSAERITAILSLRFDDVELDSGWVNFRAENRKGGQKDNGCRLHAETVALIRELRQFTSSGLLLPWPYDHGYLWERYRRDVLKPAGLPDDRDHKFHAIRKTVASYFESAGGNSTRLLGHSDSRVTHRHYIDPKIAQPEQVGDVLFRPNDDLTTPVIRRSPKPLSGMAPTSEPDEWHEFEPVKFEGNPDGWEFREGMFKLRGLWFKLEGARLRILRALVESWPGSVSADDLIPLLEGGAGFRTAREKVAHTIHPIRMKLRTILRLSPDFDPIPKVGIDKHGVRWKLQIPAGIEPQVNGAAVRKSRKWREGVA